jgi:hypothetical protein
MSKRNGDFDDEEGFFESLLNRKGGVPMPDSMVKMFKGVAALVVLTVVGLVVWAVWPNGGQNAGDTVPVVRAETDEYKVQPEDKGGMIIPNKDSTIFETMDNGAEQPNKKVENLLEDSEQPMKKEEVFTSGTPSDDNLADDASEPVENEGKDAAPAVATDDSEKSSTDDAAAAPTEEPQKSEVKVADMKEAPKVAPKTAPKEIVKAISKEKKVNIIDALKEETGTKTADAKAKSASKGSVYIQLAAVKSEADTKSKWAQLKSKYNSLSSLNLKVQKADLGAKGTFYRVQAGPVSADSASSICAKIKAAKGDCIIVK